MLFEVSDLRGSTLQGRPQGIAPRSVNLRSRATARDRPYYTTDQLGKPVYSRGDPLRSPSLGRTLHFHQNCHQLGKPVYSRGDPLRSPSLGRTPHFHQNCHWPTKSFTGRFFETSAVCFTCFICIACSIQTWSKVVHVALGRDQAHPCVKE